MLRPAVRVASRVSALVGVLVVLLMLPRGVVAQPALTCGSGATGDIGAAGEQDTLVFQGEQGDVISLSVATTAKLDPQFLAAADLVGPTGTPLRTFLYDTREVGPLPSTGTYSLRIRDYNNLHRGSYAIELHWLAPASRQCASALTCGQNVTSTTETPGGQDIWTFEGQQGDVISLSVVTTAKQDASYLASADVFGPTGTAVRSSLYDTREVGPLPSTGRYSIRVRDYHQRSRGSYALEVHWLAPAARQCAAAVTCGQHVSGALDLFASQDLLTFEGQQGDVLSLSLATTAKVDASFFATADIFGPTGAAVRSSLYDTREVGPLPTTGRYTIRVRDYYHRFRGSYALEVHWLAPVSRQCASPLTCGQSVTGTIDPQAAQDIYTIAGTQGELLGVSVSTTMRIDPSFLAGADVFAPSGSLLVSHIYNPRVVGPLPATGTYAIRMRDYYHRQRGAYGLSVTCLSAITPTPLPLGTPVPITVGSQLPVTFEMSVPAGTPDLFIRLEKDTYWNGTLTLFSGGVQVATTAGYADHMLQIRAPAAGVYRLLVAGVGSGTLTASTSLPALTLGQPRIGTIRRAWGNAWYQVDVPANQQQLSFAVEMLGIWSRMDVYAGLVGGTPRWSAAGDRMTLRIPTPAAGRYYIQLFDSGTIVGPNQARDHRILADIVEPPPPPCTTATISSFSPIRAGRGPVTVTVKGTCLNANARVRLWASFALDYFVDPQSSVVASDGRALSSVFDFSSALIGSYRLVVYGTNIATVTAPTPFVIEHDNSVALWIDIQGRAQMRLGRQQSYLISYGNRGALDAHDQVLWLSVTNGVQMTIEGVPVPYRLPIPRPATVGNQTVQGVWVPKIPAGGSETLKVTLIASSGLTHMRLSAGFLPPPPVEALSQARAGIGRFVAGQDATRIRGELAGSDDPPYPGVQVYMAPNRDNPFGHTAMTGVQDGQIVVWDPWLSSFGVPMPLPWASWKTGVDPNGTWSVGTYLGWTTPPGWTPQLGMDAAAAASAGYRVSVNVWGGKNVRGQGYSCAGWVEAIYESVGLDPVINDHLLPFGPTPGFQFEFQDGIGEFYANPEALTTARARFIFGFLRFSQEGLVWLGNALVDSMQAFLDILGVTSISPEDKYGPVGFDEPMTSLSGLRRWTSAQQPLPYRIDFWNKEDAPAPTQDVIVTDQLDAELDWSTFAFTEFGFLRWRVPLEPAQYFNVDVDLRPDFNLIVNVEGTFDLQTGQIEWRFRSQDPLTREPPEDPFAGFLPPITNTGYEIGWVDFSVSPRAGLSTGTEITNQSFVKFDVDVFKPAPPGGPFLNTLDANAPVSHVSPLDAVQNVTGFRVTWTGTDEGAGVRDYTVSVSTNGSPFQVWQSRTTATSAVFSGERNGQYAFHVVAHDHTGNAEADKTAAESTTRVAADALLDGDADGLTDEWETQYRLNPLSDAGDDGPQGDPDGDGVTNAAEFAAQTDPTLANIVTLAEGATGSFFEQRIALANPGPIPARVTLTFLQASGAPIDRTYEVPAQQRLTLVVNDIAGLEAADVSTVVRATQGGVAVERTMTWDRTLRYGGHTGKAVRAARTQWYLAEGEANFFDTFILFANANAEPATVTATYLLDSGPTVTRTYTVGGHARLTVRTNDDDALQGRPFSTTVTSTLPIIVERAMYFSAFGLPYAGGHASAAVEQPSRTWFVAEGATGEFFDQYLLFANPNTTTTTVSVRFLTTGSDEITQTYELPPTSRTTIYVDGVPGLANSPGVSAAIDATAPIIVERTMYWPSFPWQEAHSSAGLTATGTRWVLAEGETGGAQEFATYVLFANPSDADATVTMTWLRTDRPPIASSFTVPARSRVTRAAHEFPLDAGERFGVLVDSTVPIAVERAMYWNAAGQFWGAGTNETATRMR